MAVLRLLVPVPGVLPLPTSLSRRPWNTVPHRRLHRQPGLDNALGAVVGVIVAAEPVRDDQQAYMPHFGSLADEIPALAGAFLGPDALPWPGALPRGGRRGLLRPRGGHEDRGQGTAR
ncbi:hypothetical protein [Streptomyces sp. NPDC053720]|uniref:hypothetical protein n=1 Tax=Streptomyces sp. NPDC053720 TaxID=3154855 RepID=UPI0034466B66